MISFGAKKTVDLGKTEQVKGWALAALGAAPASATGMSADVTVMVAEIECKEPGCPPVETVVSFLEKSNPQKVKVIKSLAEVEEADVQFAVGRLVEELQAPPISLKVDTPLGTTVVVQTQALETVLTLKQKVEEQSGVPVPPRPAVARARPLHTDATARVHSVYDRRRWGVRPFVSPSETRVLVSSDAVPSSFLARAANTTDSSPAHAQRQADKQELAFLGHRLTDHQTVASVGLTDGGRCPPPCVNFGRHGRSPLPLLPCISPQAQRSSTASA